MKTERKICEEHFKILIYFHFIDNLDNSECMDKSINKIFNNDQKFISIKYITINCSVKEKIDI